MAVTAIGVGTAGVSSAGSLCGYTAAHRARQAANAATVMIRFFMLRPPFRTWRGRPISSPYSERLSALFQIDLVPWKSATPTQIQR